MSEYENLLFKISGQLEYWYYKMREFSENSSHEIGNALEECEDKIDRIRVRLIHERNEKVKKEEE